MNERGQIILALILVMTVALAIGLSVVQKSLVDVSTSTKVEQSQRAFSAAEAGIEKALTARSDTTGQNFDNNAQIKEITDTKLIPCIPGSSGCPQGTNDRQAALEYPPLAKEEVAHVWLTNYNSSSNPPTCSNPPSSDPADRCYTQSTLDVYWGDAKVSDKAALELTLVYYDGSQYKSRKWYLDQILRSPANNFTQVTCGAGIPVNYQCKFTLGGSADSAGALPQNMMLIRARLLYNTSSQPIAFQAPTCNSIGCFIPPQARVLKATGVSGETQRKVQVLQINKVVPPYFDFAIFSNGDIKK